MSCKEPLAVALSTWHGVENIVLSEILEDLASEFLLTELYTKAVLSKEDAIKEVKSCCEKARQSDQVTTVFHSLFLNDTEPKICSDYELIKHEKSEFRLTKKEKDIKLEALLCCERIKFDEKFSGITLSVQNEDK